MSVHVKLDRGSPMKPQTRLSVVCTRPVMDGSEIHGIRTPVLDYEYHTGTRKTQHAAGPTQAQC
eukprot:scaffold107446_cov48-Prasinocladus_malaysianus.AAC.2